MLIRWSVVCDLVSLMCCFYSIVDVYVNLPRQFFDIFSCHTWHIFKLKSAKRKRFFQQVLITLLQIYMYQKLSYSSLFGTKFSELFAYILNESLYIYFSAWSKN